MIDYPLMALLLVGFAIFMYVILDGFGLGVGILFPFMTEKEQGVALKSIAPVWDGNETWLVLGGVLLYACFPKVYATILPTLYLPLMLMLCALVGRGVAFEFRAKATTSKETWARCFFFSSLIATFCQGCLLGSYIQISHANMILKGGMIWANPFVFLCGIGLCFGYAFLGSGWLLIKTQGGFEEKMRYLAINLYAAVTIVLALILFITPLAVSGIAELWFSHSLIIKSILLLGYFSGIFWAFYQTFLGSVYWAFLGGVWVFLGSFMALCYSLYPHILPNQHYRELASHDSALFLVVSATLFLLPVLLGYSGYAYWVFWGKIDEEASFYE